MEMLDGGGGGGGGEGVGVGGRGRRWGVDLRLLEEGFGARRRSRFCVGVGLMLDVEEGGVEYLTCVEVKGEDLPWLRGRGGGGMRRVGGCQIGTWSTMTPCDRRLLLFRTLSDPGASL